MNHYESESEVILYVFSISNNFQPPEIENHKNTGEFLWHIKHQMCTDDNATYNYYLP